MDDRINVCVVDYGRKYLYMRFRDPESGKQNTRSTGKSNRREAERVAAKWEAELREGRYQKPARMRWEEFREYYEDNVSSTQKKSTAANYASALNAFERACRPERVSDMTTERVAAFVRELRSRKLTEPSVARHLRHLKAVSNWAKRQGFLNTVPTFEMPKRADTARMKGRPITLEEFERMLDATDSVVGDQAAESWRFLLNGLWSSGLRLGEAMALRWDHQPGSVSVRLNDRRSVLAFDGDAQKSGKVQLVPLAPEAVSLLEPFQQEEGFVFEPLRRRGPGAMARHTEKIGKLISQIGAAAGVIVDHATGKTASAHDLRRAFGFRWSRRVMPAQLKSLMRHASIETTMTFYVDQSAEIAATELWDALGNTSGNTRVQQSLAEVAEGSLS